MSSFGEVHLGHIGIELIRVALLALLEQVGIACRLVVGATQPQVDNLQEGRGRLLLLFEGGEGARGPPIYKFQLLLVNI